MEDLDESEKLEKIRELYADRKDDTAKKILDSFASKSNWRSESLVHRIAQETQLSERDIRDFLKDKLQGELGLGRYIKGAQGKKSRFEWDVDAGYSLVRVGKAAQRKSDTLKEDDGETLSDEAEGDEIVEETIKIGRGRFFKAEFPNDITEKEFDLFVAVFKSIYMND